MEPAMRFNMVPPGLNSRNLQKPTFTIPSTSVVSPKAVAKVASDEPRLGEFVSPVSGVEDVVNEMNRFLEKSTHIRFRIEEGQNQVVVSIVDAESRKVIRQIPSEEMLELNSRIKELQGVIYSKQA